MPIKLEVIGGEALQKAGQRTIVERTVLMQKLVRASGKFGLDAVYNIKTKHLSGPRPAKLKSEGLLKASITTQTKVSGNTIQTSVGSNLVYARIHELGGQINITDRMRKAMWSLYYRKGEEKYKFMALTKKTRITIPARPYLRPGVEETLPSFVENIGHVLSELRLV